MRKVKSQNPADFHEQVGRAEDSSDGAFQSETSAVMVELGRSLGQLVRAVSREIRRPIELQRLLKLDSKLCWQVFNVIRADGSLSAAQHVPGTPSISRLLTAAEDARVPADVLDAVRSAIYRFNELVLLHGPDRASFDSMVTAASSAEDSASSDLFHRRNAYRSESHIWGVQVDTYVASSFVHPSADRQGKDECSVTLRVGQRRLRSDAPVIVHRSSTHASFKMLPANARHPLDLEAAERLNAPLLPEFSSDPLPPMRTVLQETGWTQVEVRGGAVGKQASFDLAFGGIVRDVPFSRDATDRPVLRQSVRFITPAGLFIMDCMIHRPSFKVTDPSVIVFPRTDGPDVPQTFKSTQRLPVHVEIEQVDVNSPNLAIPEFRRYQELLRYACRTQNWNLSEFDLYRIRVPYPILNSIVRMELPIEPTA